MNSRREQWLTANVRLECSMGQFDLHVVNACFPIVSNCNESRNSKRTVWIDSPQLSPIWMVFNVGRWLSWRVEIVGSQRLSSPMVNSSIVKGEEMEGNEMIGSLESCSWYQPLWRETRLDSVSSPFSHSLSYSQIPVSMFNTRPEPFRFISPLVWSNWHPPTYTGRCERRSEVDPLAYSIISDGLRKRCFSSMRWSFSHFL